MIKFISFIFTLFFMPILHSYGQDVSDDFSDFTRNQKSDNDINNHVDTVDFSEVYSLLKNASLSLCEKDTLKTIKYLRKYIDEFSNMGTDRLIRIRLAELYTELGDVTKAEELYESVISLNNTKNDFNIQVEPIGECKPIISASDYIKAKSDACIGLYKIAMTKNNPEKGLKYLTLSSTKFFPNTGCGNGNDLNKLYIIRHYIDYYLYLKDTTNAINIGLDHVLHESGSKISIENMKVIRLLLLKKFSEKEIHNEVEKAITSIYKEKYTENVEEKSKVYFKLFGHNIERINHYSDDSEEEIRNYLRKYETINLLKDGKY